MFAVAILASGIAAADTIRVTGLGLGDGSINHTDLWISENGSDADVAFAGIIDIQLTQTGVSGTFNRTTMCVQLFTDIGENTTYDTTVLLPSAFSPPTETALHRIAWLLDNETPTTNDQAAGLQLAIWDIEVDAGDGFTSGAVQKATGSHTTTAAVLSDAISYEAASVGQSSNLAFVYENVTQGRNPAPAQMLEGLEFPTGPQGHTPESSTFVLAGVALLAFGRMARRKLISH